MLDIRLWELVEQLESGYKVKEELTCRGRRGDISCNAVLLISLHYKIVGV